MIKMNRTELIAIGDASVRKALANMFAILNGKGEMLSAIGGDRMVFSPHLECDGDCSAVLFDDADKARRVIDTILIPQDEGGDYQVFGFESLGDGPGEPSDGVEGLFDIDDGGCDGDFEDSENGLDDGYEEIDVDDAIAQCREIASSCDDCECCAYWGNTNGCST